MCELIEGYEPKDIFNIDETGLFFKCMPNKTLTFKGEKCSGRKNSKERVTVLVGANMDGSEKLPLLMIGKSAKPRCFKSVKSLPVQYEANKKAWMTSELFENWLATLDKKLNRSNRRILLFIDNCTAHSKTPKLKCIKIINFPPNMTSVVQPMDQGIIQNLKHLYRRQVVLKILDNATEKTNINLLDAGRMLNKAWNQVTQQTIRNCFRKAGFNNEKTNVEVATEELNLDIGLSVVTERWREVATDVSYNTYVDVDSEVAVCGELTEEEIVQQVTQKHDLSDDEYEGEDGVTEEPVPTSSEALKMVGNLRRFIEYQANVSDDLFHAINKIEDFVNCVKINKPKQTEITNFFK